MKEGGAQLNLPESQMPIQNYITFVLSISQQQDCLQSDFIVALIVLLDSSVIIVTGLGAQRSGVRFPAEVTDISLSKAFRPALGPAQSPVQWGW